MAANPPDPSSNTPQKRTNSIVAIALALFILIAFVITGLAIRLTFAGYQWSNTIQTIFTIVGVFIGLIALAKPEIILESFKALGQLLYRFGMWLFRVTVAILKRASRISNERRVQIGAILIIVLCIVSSSIWWNQISVASNAAAIATHYPFSNHEVLNDPLTKASEQEKRHWDTQHCLFADQGYVDEVLKVGYFNPCFASDTNFANFTYEVTMTITEGDCGALLFRGSRDQSAFYFFGLCQDGRYYVGPYGPKYGDSIFHLSYSGFDIGLNFPITFGVVARGNNISLYVDGIFIKRLASNAYAQGHIGVMAKAINSPTQVLFSNAKVWVL